MGSSRAVLKIGFLFFYLHLFASFPPSFGVQHTNKVSFSNGVGQRGIGLADIFEDSDEEVLIPRKLQGQFPLPLWLRGSLIRNGPGLFGVSSSRSKKSRRFDHIFDGLAKLSCYNFPGDGGVQFSSRFLDTYMYKTIRSGKIPPAIYTGPVIPRFNTFQKIKGLFVSYFDNAPVNICQIGGKKGPWVATTDAPVLIEFDPNTLETKGRLKFSNPIAGLGGVELFCTAHPHTKDEFTYNIFQELRPFSKNNKVHLVRADSSMQRSIVASFDIGKNLPYIHDFSLTENYAVLCLWPLNLKTDGLLSEGVMKEMKWLGDQGTNSTIVIFDLKRGSVLSTYGAPPMFAYHHINAYETPEEIVLDFVGYTKPDIVNGDHAFAYISNIQDLEKRKLQTREGKYFRFHIPLLPTDSAEKLRFLIPFELVALSKCGKYLTADLVTINTAKERMKHRYSYGLSGFAGADEYFGGYEEWAIVKMDHDTAAQNAANQLTPPISPWSVKPCATLWSSDHCYPSEPTFVSNPSGIEEDEGVLLSQVYDGVKRETFLLVLDAQTMKEMSRWYTGARCPVSFHGKFLHYEP